MVKSQCLTREIMIKPTDAWWLNMVESLKGSIQVPCFVHSKVIIFGVQIFPSGTRKHYPLAIVAFFCLLNGPSELGVVAALALGYLRERIQIDAVLPSDGKVQRHSGHRGAGQWLKFVEHIQQKVEQCKLSLFL